MDVLAGVSIGSLVLGVSQYLLHPTSLMRTLSLPKHSWRRQCVPPLLPLGPGPCGGLRERLAWFGSGGQSGTQPLMRLGVFLEPSSLPNTRMCACCTQAVVQASACVCVRVHVCMHPAQTEFNEGLEWTPRHWAAVGASFRSCVHPGMGGPCCPR